MPRIDIDIDSIEAPMRSRTDWEMGKLARERKVLPIETLTDQYKRGLLTLEEYVFFTKNALDAIS